MSYKLNDFIFIEIITQKVTSSCPEFSNSKVPNTYFIKQQATAYNIYEMTFTSGRERICETNGSQGLFFLFLKPILSSSIENLSKEIQKTKQSKNNNKNKNGNQKSINHDLAQS